MKPKGKSENFPLDQLARKYSSVGHGTTFTVRLPVNLMDEDDHNVEGKS